MTVSYFILLLVCSTGTVNCPEQGHASIAYVCTIIRRKSSVALAICRYYAIKFDIVSNATQTVQGFPYVAAIDLFGKPTFLNIKGRLHFLQDCNLTPKKPLCICFSPLAMTTSHQKPESVPMEEVR